METRGGVGGIIPVFNEFQVIDPEERAAVDQRILAVVVGGIACPCNARNGAVHEIDAFHCLFDMKLTGFAAAVGSAPVADTVGCVAVLLDFE